jgi:hypothetical protein
VITFLHPWGLLGLLAVPAVWLLHRLRRRLVERRVAGLFLFAPDALSEDAGRTPSPILRTPSLWIELAAALLLGVLVAGPRLSGDRRAPHVVVVLDDTASMGAVHDGLSVAEAARSELRTRLRVLPHDATVSLLVTGRPPAALAGPRASPPEALEALARWSPRAPHHGADSAFDAALDLAGPGDAILFATDLADPEVPARVEVLAFGRPAEGTAVASARRIRESDRETLVADVVAFARAPRAVDVTVLAGEGDAEREIARRRVEVAPGHPARLSLDVPATDLPLRVRLGGDALALDDEALLLPDPLRRVPYAVDMPPATAAALGLDRLPRAAPAAVSADLAVASLVFATAEGEPPAGTTRVVIAPSDPERDAWVGPFLVDRGHPLVDGTTLEGVVWSAGRGALPGRGIVFAGEHAILTEESDGVTTTLRLDLDVAASTLHRSADWPILLANVVDRARATLPGPSAANVRVGETLRFRGAATGSVARTLVRPSGAREGVPGGPLVEVPAEEPGLHRLLAGEEEVARWAVHFVDGLESDLRDRGSARRPAREPPQRDALALAGIPGAGALVRVLAFAVLVLAVADAWVLAGRRRRARTS